MKYLIILLFSLLLSFNTQAADFELSAMHMRITQNLFGSISFPTDALLVSGTVRLNSGLGLTVETGASTETANNMYVAGKRYSARIYRMRNVIVSYRYEIDERWGFDAGVGYTDYRTKWTVNGEPASWDNDTDCDIMYSASLSYKYNKHMSMRANYTDYYGKHKPNFGDETTRGIGFGFAYSF